MPDGSLVPLTINVETPGNQADIDATMLHNAARNLPDAIPVKSCLIVGSGPSALSDALWDHLYEHPDTTTLALNGALSLFLERGFAPTYWACCDPQELTLDFVMGLYLPRETTYLLATKCPQSLFDHIQSRSLRIETWRLDDMVLEPGKLHCPSAVSISLVAQSLMRFKGYHRFEHYGWDCCYVDGKHHANTQPEPDQLQDLEFIIQDEQGQTLGTFPTNGSWLAELHDAAIQAFNLKVLGYQLVVHGTNAVASLLKLKGLAETPDIA